MDKGNKIACKIAELWRLHNEQKAIYQRTMTEEVSRELRDICGKGFFVSSICMNEIQVIYNNVKSPLDDIASDTSEGNDERAESAALNRMTDYLRSRQKRLIDSYTGVLGYFEHIGSHSRVLTDHITMLKGLVERLDNSSGETESFQKQRPQLVNGKREISELLKYQKKEILT